MELDIRSQLTPGVQVKVTQQIAARDHSWSSEVRGSIVAFAQRQTGSWYAHSKNDKLWLDRLTLRKADGEIITLNLDDYSVIEVQAPTGAQPDASDAPAEPTEPTEPVAP